MKFCSIRQMLENNSIKQNLRLKYQSIITERFTALSKLKKNQALIKNVKAVSKNKIKV